MNRLMREQQTPVWAIALVAIAIGSALSIGGFAHLGASLHLLKGEQAVDILKRGQLPTRDGFARLLESRTGALAWRDLGGAWIDRGTGYLGLAMNSGRPDLFAAAIQDLEAGLSRRPVHPHGWFRLAFALSKVGQHERAAAAANLSMITGPSVPELILPRAELGLRLWTHLSPSARERFGPEFARATERDSDGFVDDVRASGHVAEVLEALARFRAAQAGLRLRLDGE